MLQRRRAASLLTQTTSGQSAFDRRNQVLLRLCYTTLQVNTHVQPVHILSRHRSQLDARFGLTEEVLQCRQAAGTPAEGCACEGAQTAAAGGLVEHPAKGEQYVGERMLPDMLDS